MSKSQRTERTYYFDDHYLVAGYVGEKFVGVFVTKKGETIPISDFVKAFTPLTPDFFVAQRVPPNSDTDPDELFDMSQVLSPMIQHLASTKFSDINDKELTYIARVLH